MAAAWDGASKDLKQAFRKMAKAGADVTIQGNGHILVTLPNGEKFRFPMTSVSWHTIAQANKLVKRMNTGYGRKIAA